MLIQVNVKQEIFRAQLSQVNQSQSCVFQVDPPAQQSDPIDKRLVNCLLSHCDFSFNGKGIIFHR